MITDFDKRFWETYDQADEQDTSPELARYIGQLEIWTQLADPDQAAHRLQAIEVLRERLDLLLADAAALDAAPHVLYRQEMIKCGKAQCKKCSTGPTHGPYWYAFTTTNGKTTKKYLGKELPKTFRPNKDVAHPYNPAVNVSRSVKPKASLPPAPEQPHPATLQLKIPATQPLRAKKVKIPPANFWLIDREADTMPFEKQEDAQRWASKLKTKWKIYQATSREEAWTQHQAFLVRQANGQALW